jgi:hypothetical protein
MQRRYSLTSQISRVVYSQEVAEWLVRAPPVRR